MFATKAIAAGVGAAWALPIRHGDDTLGALLILGSGMGDADLRVAEVLVEEGAQVTAGAARSSSMKANPVVLSEAALAEVLAGAM